MQRQLSLGLIAFVRSPAWMLARPEQVSVERLDDDGVDRALLSRFHDRRLVRAVGIEDARDAAGIEVEDGRRADLTIADTGAATLVHFHDQLPRRCHRRSILALA